MCLGTDFPFPRETSEVVHALEHNRVTNARLHQYITVEAGERVRSQPIDQQMVAANTMIQHAEIPQLWHGLQTLSQHICPPIIAVGGGAMPVCNGVPQSDNGAGTLGSKNVNPRDLIPVF